MSILVVGSFIIDLVATTKKAPEAGETVVGSSFNTYYGGKGANQAVAAKRMGSDVKMVGCVGSDLYGSEFIKLFEKEGFDISFIKKSKEMPTGCSIVTVEESGQNRIVMTKGANEDFSSDDVLVLEEEVKNTDIVVCQLEMKYEVVTTLTQLAKKHHKKIILNPAPARYIDNEVLNGLFLITPNETELGLLINKEIKSKEEYVEGAKILLNYGCENVVVTLGSLGALLVNKNGFKFYDAYKVKAIDTVGAGDSFTGSLAALIDQGFELNEAIKIANAVGALEVQKHGGIPSMPYRNEVFDFLKEK